MEINSDMGKLHADLTGDELHIGKTQVSIGNPNGSVTAGVIGELYWDTTANILYVAEAVNNSSWISISEAGDQWTELSDTPSSISSGLAVQGNSGGTALEFGQALNTTDNPSFGTLTLTGAASSTTLSLDSTTGVLRIPRLNITQREALTPLTGFQIFNTDSEQAEVYSGTAWIAMVSTGANISGTPVNNQLAVWTDSSSIEGDSDLTFDGLNLTAGGSVSVGTEYQQGGLTILLGDSANNNLQAGLSAGSAITTGAGLTALGHQALNANTVGNFNTAAGFKALFTNIAGGENSAFGNLSLSVNIGTNNDAFGYLSLVANTTGSNNSAFGSAALEANTTGTDNIGIGGGALDNNVLGRRNIAIGAGTGTNIASATLTGENTLLGYNTGLGITTGIQNTVIGANVTGLPTTLSNNIILADGAGVTRLQFNSSGDGVIGGGLQVTGALLDTSGDPGTSGQVLSSTVTGTNWISVVNGGLVVGANTNVTTIVIQNVFVDLDLGTAAESGNNDGFTLTNTTTGEIRYDGASPITLNVTGLLTASSSGGSQRFNFRALKNGAVLPSPDNVDVPIEVGSGLRTAALGWAVSMVTNDLFRIQVANADGTSNITIDTLKYTIN